MDATYGLDVSCIFILHQESVNNEESMLMFGIIGNFILYLKIEKT